MYIPLVHIIIYLFHSTRSKSYTEPGNDNGNGNGNDQTMAAEGKETEKEPPATVPEEAVAVAVVDEVEVVVVKKPFTRRTRQSAMNSGESLGLDGELRIGGGNWHASSNNSNNTAGGDPTLAALEREHEEVTKVKNIERIYIGQWEVRWKHGMYYSPYSEEYICLCMRNDCLFVNFVSST